VYKRIAVIVGIVAVAAPICIFIMFQVMARCEDYGWRLADQAERLRTQASSRENTEMALQKYEWAAFMFRLSYSRGMRCRILTRIGNIWEERGNNSKATACFEEAYRLAKALGWPLGQSEALSHLASLHLDQKQYLAAVKAFKECASLSKQAGDEPLEQYALHCEAIACDHLGQATEAIKCYARALEIAEKRHEVKAQMQMFGPLAYLYFVNGDYAKAAETCMKGLKLADRRGDSECELDEATIRKNLDEVLREWEKKYPGNDGLKRVRSAMGESAHAQDRLFAAIRRADIEAVKELLAIGARVNVLDKTGETPLGLAAREGSLEIVKLLVANGASLKMPNSFSQTAGQAALSEALAHCREDLARYFFQLGVKIGGGFREDTSTIDNAAKCSPTLMKLVLDEAIKSRQKSYSAVAIDALAAAAQAGNV
jgi:tetratricopeptide (TPR) repeat protein